MTPITIEPSGVPTLRFAYLTTDASPRVGDVLGKGTARVVVPVLGELVPTETMVEIFNPARSPVPSGSLVAYSRVVGHDMIVMADASGS